MQACYFLFNPILWFVKVDAPEGAPATYTNYWGYEIDLLYSIGRASTTYQSKAWEGRRDPLELVSNQFCK